MSHDGSHASLPGESRCPSPTPSPIVIGVGASAGGLEALQRMFETIPPDGNFCFVVVQHLAPDHKSMMVELLSRHTPLEVREITQDMEVAGNCVLMLPPGKTVTISRDRLHLSSKSATGGVALPIDQFLISLAKCRRRRSAAIILSGTGTDGTRGVDAIRQSGGLVLVQDPLTAKFDGMPRSVIQAGLHDACVAPEDMGATLTTMLSGGEVGAPQDEVSRDSLRVVIEALQQETGVDFADYKEGTISRRVERRMQMNGITSLSEYLSLLRRSSGEVTQLYKDLLIGVTKFFRDPEAFSILREKVVPEIVARALDGGTIRCWVCGCSSGEEAYSLAILLNEEIVHQQKTVDVKIFATDLDRDAIEAASRGGYDQDALSELPNDLRDRYFSRRGDHWVAARQIRQSIVFARHNILSDPPFTKLELVSCRNLLIYMEPVLQRRVLALFNYSLNRDGILFLGASETLGELSSEFTTLDFKHKIFRAGGNGAPLPQSSLSAPQPQATMRTRRRQPGDDETAIDQGLGLLVEAFSPPALLVTDRGDLLHVFGDASRYLRMPMGSATLNILKLLPSTLSSVTGSILYKALRDEKEIHQPAVPVSGPEGIELLNLTLRPFTQQNGKRFALLVLIPARLASAAEDAPLDPDAVASERIKSLEHDLKTSQQSLQATVEELETSNEELQAANEELLASNEELQSTNEELQSVNEELYTLNSEYEAKIDELTRLTDDMDNLLRVTEVGTVFLNRDLVIRRFTPSAAAFINLIGQDVGRSIAHISHKLDYADFLTDLEAVRDGAGSLEREVMVGENHVLVRMHPYTADHGGEHERLAGVVVTFVDVTSIRSAERRLQSLVDTLPEQVCVLDHQGKVVFANQAWRQAPDLPFPTLAGAAIGENYAEFCLRHPFAQREDAAQAIAGLQDILDGKARSLSVAYAWEHGREYSGVLKATVLDDVGIVISHILASKEMLLGEGGVK